MALKPDHKYHGTVAPGSEIIESQSGSIGYQVMLECEDGTASYTIWLTQKNRERAEKTFTEALGVDREKLADANYLEDVLATEIAGREVTFVTEEEEYKGKRRVKVAWLFRRSASGGGSPAKAAARFFGGNDSRSNQHADPITDDDLPF